MLLDAEAAASVILNGAALLDRRDAGAADARTLARMWTPLAKYWITLRARDVTAEAMNVRGGNGYIEDWVNSRLIRDAHIGVLWEGTSNINALDVINRAVAKSGGHETLGRALKAKLKAATAAPATVHMTFARRRCGGGTCGGISDAFGSSRVAGGAYFFTPSPVICLRHATMVCGLSFSANSSAASMAASSISE